MFGIHLYAVLLSSTDSCRRYKQVRHASWNQTNEEIHHFKIIQYNSPASQTNHEIKSFLELLTINPY